MTLFLHLLSLIGEKTLLILAILDLVLQFFVTLLMDLVNDLTEQVVVVRAIKHHFLVEPGTSLTIYETLQEGIWHLILSGKRKRLGSLLGR